MKNPKYKSDEKLENFLGDEPKKEFTNLYLLVMKNEKTIWLYLCRKQDDGTGTLSRTPKKFYYWYKDLIETNGENL